MTTDTNSRLTPTQPTLTEEERLEIAHLKIIVQEAYGNPVTLERINVVLKALDRLTRAQKETGE